MWDIKIATRIWHEDLNFQVMYCPLMRLERCAKELQSYRVYH